MSLGCVRQVVVDFEFELNKINRNEKKLGKKKKIGRQVTGTHKKDDCNLHMHRLIGDRAVVNASVD